MPSTSNAPATGGRGRSPAGRPEPPPERERRPAGDRAAGSGDRKNEAVGRYHGPTGGTTSDRSDSEMLLAQLKVESLQLRLLTSQVDAIGVALKHGMITDSGARHWLADLFGEAQEGSSG